MENYIRQVAYTENTRLQGSHQLLPFLTELQNGPLPKPVQISRTDKKNVGVNSFCDKAALNFLDKKKYALEFLDDAGKGISLIVQMPKHDTSTSINYRYAYWNSEIESLIGDFFTRSIKSTNPYLCKIELAFGEEELYSMYDRNPRTFYSPGLLWLQYYAGAELERQGGIEAIEKNPYIKTERFHEGIIVQVGESPFDIQTIPGRALLVKATEAMPPVKSHS